MLVFVDIRFYSKSALDTYFYLLFMGVLCLCSGLFVNLRLIQIYILTYVVEQIDCCKTIGNLFKVN